jgi:hypothetical protein
MADDFPKHLADHPGVVTVSGGWFVHDHEHQHRYEDGSPVGSEGGWHKHRHDHRWHPDQSHHHDPARQRRPVALELDAATGVGTVHYHARGAVCTDDCYTVPAVAPDPMASVTRPSQPTTTLPPDPTTSQGG